MATKIDFKKYIINYDSFSNFFNIMKSKTFNRIDFSAIFFYSVLYFINFKLLSFPKVTVASSEFPYYNSSAY